jgi:hypothetical protein
MPRFVQTWTCTCGHVATKGVTYPKYGASELPLKVIAAKARCTKCGKRGTCTIREKKA